MQSGIFLIDKDAGPTSAQVLNALKRKIKPEKIGHSGTLDPFATGLLIVLIGRATRLAQYAEGGRKRYRALMKLGVATDTDDCLGKVLAEGPVTVSDDQLQVVCARYRGEITQVPSRYSAIKVEGRRAYDLAREGEDFELAGRRVTVSDLQVRRVSNELVELLVECSPGTYIRALARDIGKELGCGASLLELRRVGSAPFDITQAISLDKADWTQLMPWDRLFGAGARIRLSDADCAALSRGEQQCLRAFTHDGDESEILVYQDAQGAARGILCVREQALHLGVAIS